MDMTDRVRRLADIASDLGHNELATDLHEVARREEGRRLAERIAARPAGSGTALAAWLERLRLRGHPDDTDKQSTAPHRSTGSSPRDPMTIEERDAADEAWKQAEDDDA